MFSFTARQVPDAREQTFKPRTGRGRRTPCNDVPLGEERQSQAQEERGHLYSRMGAFSTWVCQVGAPLGSASHCAHVCRLQGIRPAAIFPCNSRLGTFSLPMRGRNDVPGGATNELCGWGSATNRRKIRGPRRRGAGVVGPGLSTPHFGFSFFHPRCDHD